MKKIKQSFMALSEAVKGTSKKSTSRVGILTGKVSDLGGNSINRLARLTRTWRVVIILFVFVTGFNILESQGKFIHDVLHNGTFGVINLMVEKDGVRHWFTHGNIFDWNFASLTHNDGVDWYTNVTLIGTVGFYTILVFGILALKGSHPTKRLVDTFLTDYFVTEIKEGRIPDRIVAEITVKEKIKTTKFWKEITTRPDGKRKGLKGIFFHDGYLVNEIDIQYENVFAVTMAKHYGAKLTEENKEVLDNAEEIKD